MCGSVTSYVSVSVTSYVCGSVTSYVCVESCIRDSVERAAAQPLVAAALVEEGTQVRAHRETRESNRRHRPGGR